MADRTVVFDGVWKRFRRGERHTTLRDLVPAMARRLVGRGGAERALDEFWALRDVSFAVRPGTALGIIGPNGAGKSTVLKLLTRIMRPTRGRIEVSGRIGALIEIAAGFHADLTGRENIFLQGAIMGMRRAEIARTFDEIVEFSGVADFIDTQVKRYSSGMNARLGFAIAAHLDPDVLVIDEVLAVGDFAFQQKAFARIAEMVRRDIPVVVVSHQLDRITALCTDALLLDRGAVVRQGSPADCVAAYVQHQRPVSLPTDARSAIVLDAAEPRVPGAVPSGGRARVMIAGTVTERDRLPGDVVTIRVRASQSGEVVFATSSERCGIELPPEGPFVLDVELEMNVPEGLYFVETLIRDRREGRLVTHGPHAMVQVRGGPAFHGTVQMSPLMHIARPDADARSVG